MLHGKLIRLRRPNRFRTSAPAAPDAFQLVRVHPRLPAGDGRGLPAARAQLEVLGARLADARLGGLLRLLAAAQPADHRALDRGELRLRPGAARPRRRRQPGAAAQRGAGARHPRQRRLPRLFQIRQLLGLGGERPDGVRLHLPQRDPAARHLLHHLPEDRLPDRRGRPADPQLHLERLPLVRDVLPAADRGTDRALQRDDPAVRARHLPVRHRPLRHRPDALLLRPLQEGGARRRHCRACLAGLRLRRHRGGGDAHPGLARRGRLHPADLLRLLRLQRHGLRRGAVLRRAAAGQLRLAAPGPQHHRLLAALARDADPLPDGLCLQPAGAGADPAAGGAGAGDAARPRLGPGRLPAGAGGAGARHHAALGPLARRRLYLHPLGRAARALHRDQPRLAPVRAGAGRGGRCSAGSRASC